MTPVLNGNSGTGGLQNNYYSNPYNSSSAPDLLL